MQSGINPVTLRPSEKKNQKKRETSMLKQTKKSKL